VSAKDTGGPAFPARWSSLQGMTLRDYFAAKALVMLADPAVTADAQAVAAVCYRIADAMLKERAKP
jgi:hypothetical protein